MRLTTHVCRFNVAKHIKLDWAHSVLKQLTPIQHNCSHSHILSILLLDVE